MCFFTCPHKYMYVIYMKPLVYELDYESGKEIFSSAIREQVLVIVNTEDEDSTKAATAELLNMAKVFCTLLHINTVLQINTELLPVIYLRFYVITNKYPRCAKANKNSFVLLRCVRARACESPPQPQSLPQPEPQPEPWEAF